VGQTYGLYRELDNYNERQISGYTLMNINGSLSYNERYRLAITYSGPGTLYDGTRGFGDYSFRTSSVIYPEITNVEITDPMTSEVKVHLEDLVANSFYILTIRDGYYGKILHQSTVRGTSNTFTVNLTLNGLTVPISGFNTRSFFVQIQRVGESYSDSKELINIYYNDRAAINAYFDPFFINPNTTELPFTLKVYNAGGTYHGETDFTISVKTDDGSELASIAGDKTTIVQYGDEYEISGTLNFSSLPNFTDLFIFFNSEMIDSVYVSDELLPYQDYLMRDWTSKTFWLMMDKLYLQTDVINSSGTAKLVLQNESGTVVTESNVVAGKESKYYNHLNYEFILTPQLENGQKYSLVLVDGEKEYAFFWDFIYDGEFSFNYQNDFYLRTHNVSAGDTRIGAEFYAWNCKNMTSADLSNFLKNLVLKDGKGNINTITGFTNGRYEYGIYYFDVILSSPLSAGDYTLIYPDGEGISFTVYEPYPEDKTPRIHGYDAGDGYVIGEYLPADAVYTAKIYQGYNCLTNEPFVLTLGGEYTNNFVQHLYIPNDIIRELTAGVYEMRVYKDGIFFGSIPLTKPPKPQQTVVAVYDPMNAINVLLSTSGYVSFNVLGANKYKQLRFSEDPAELNSIAYEEFLHRSYELSPGDGEKVLYVQLKDDSGNESDIFNLKIYRLVDTLPALYVHENQRGVYAEDNVTLLLGADTQYLDAFVDFINPEGIRLATAQLNYKGLGKVTAFGDSEDVVIESDHPYKGSGRKTWVYTLEGNPSSILVTFSCDTYVAENSDFIFIYDGSDNLIGEYTGDQLAYQTLNIPGDTVKVVLHKYSSNPSYGFRIVSVVDSLENSGDSSELKHIFSSTISTTSWSNNLDWNHGYFDSLGVEPNLRDTMFVRFYLGTGNINDRTILSEVTERFLVFGSPDSIIMPQFYLLNRYSTNDRNVTLRGFATPNSKVTLKAEDDQGQGFTAEVQADHYGYFTYTAENIKEGEYTLYARDDHGLSLEILPRIIIDRTPPTISRLELIYVDYQNVAVKWACSDTNICEIRLYVNGIIAGTFPLYYEAAYTYNILARYGDSFILVVKDITGNNVVITREIGDEDVGNISAVLSCPTSAEPGDSFVAGIGLNNLNKDVFAQDITLTYDADVFEYVSVSPENYDIVILREDTATDGRLRLIAANIVGLSGTVNRIFNLVFKVKDGIGNTEGNIAITSAKLGFAPEGTVIEAGVDSKSIAVYMPVPGVDKTALIAAIDNAQSLYDSAVVGTEPGQYPQEAKDALLAAINTAKVVKNDAYATQSEVDNAVIALNNTVEIFRGSVNKSADLNSDGTIDVGDLAIVAYYYGTDSESPTWNEAKIADMNNDNVIDITDLAYIASNIPA